MKKITIVLLIISVFALVACSSVRQEDKSNSDFEKIMINTELEKDTAQVNTGKSVL